MSNLFINHVDRSVPKIKITEGITKDRRKHKN